MCIAGVGNCIGARYRPGTTDNNDRVINKFIAICYLPLSLLYWRPRDVIKATTGRLAHAHSHKLLAHFLLPCLSSPTSLTTPFSYIIIVSPYMPHFEIRFPLFYFQPPTAKFGFILCIVTNSTCRFPPGGFVTHSRSSYRTSWVPVSGVPSVA